ncbi:hypothetical protein DRH14_01495 [Candidatus Shapirobacteria bacterium]|nr:MAG: hypothetical protein DRH14_01495 [Candidatus Shapirobacteria bacterium]
MPRRRRRRKIAKKFNDVYFKPRGIPLSLLREIEISHEEIENLRLRFVEKLGQRQSAEKMGISQSQYQRDLVKILEKLTRALINGWAIKIEKGKEKEYR